MDESRGEEPAAGTGPPISPAAGRAIPPQARSAYNKHVAGCPVCRDIDRERCGEGQALWLAWNAACDDAFERLASETPR